MAEPSYLASMLPRLVMWAPVPISSLMGLVMPAAFLIGILAARHRVLEEPGRHLPLLWRTAVLRVALGWSAGLSSATAMLVGTGVWLLTVVVAHRLDLAGIRAGTPRPPSHHLEDHHEQAR